MTIALEFILGVALIVGGAELFTNAVEWAGFRMHLGSGATGSLLAAIGTALPETSVPIVALLTGAPGADSVALGAVLGAPFLLLTLGMSLTGVAVVLRRRRPELRIDPAQARRDLGIFVVAFVTAVASAALPHAVRPPVGVGLLAVYTGYVVATLRGGTPAEEMPEPLHLVRRRPGPPPLPVVIAQLVMAVGLLVGGSKLFVLAIDGTARSLGLSSLILALILVPVATELPETFNSVLWIRSHDDGLAFGNVAGSAAFQACILGFIGLTFTSWSLGTAGLITAVLTAITAVFLLVVVRDGRTSGWWLAAAAIPWVLFVGGALSGLVPAGR